MIKINELQLENVKRIKAVKLEPSSAGLTIIGGKNDQGKTSVLDSIAWALGGDKYKPSQPERDGALIPPNLHIELSNGLVVERKGKNSDLKVIDPNGNKAGQQLLNEFIEQLALDLPKFMQSTSKEKANTLLRIIGVGDQLAELDRQESELYNRRLEIGRIADQKMKFAREMVTYPGVPKEPISVFELIQKQQQILAQNGENQRKRENLKYISSHVKDLEEQLRRLNTELESARIDLAAAQKSAEDLYDESTAELEQSIANIEAINNKIRVNLDKEKAEMEAEGYQRQYDNLSADIHDIRQARMDLLNSADLPLPGLSVDDGELTYEGYKWDNLSASKQLKVAVAIIRKLNPNCGFVLMDKLEQMDMDTLTEFGAWLENEGLQVIATRVSTGGECSIIIEDGYSKQPETEQKKWKAGEF